jgi:organic radical activating enzyme
MSNKIKNSSFCVLPFIHVAADPGGEIKPCCLTRNRNVDATGKPYNLGYDKIETFFNSDYMKSLRKDMMTDVRPTTCQTCYDEESSGGISQRQTYTKGWFEKDPELTQKILDSELQDYQIEPDIKYFDLRFGNMCNLKCRSCGPVNSVQLLKESREIQINNPEIRKYFLFNDKKVDNINDWYQTSEFWENFVSQEDNVEQLYFTGGEPTIIEQNYAILNRLVETGRSQSVSLIFSTNMTNIQPKFLDLINQFKSVTFLASCEGYGNVHEYLRYPAKWSVFETNIRKLAKMDPHRITIHCTPVVQSVNLSQITEFFKWIDSINEEYGFNRVNILPIVLTFPTHLTFEILPYDMKQRALIKLNEFLKTSRSSLNPHFVGRINVIVDKCNKDMYNETELIKFKEFTLLLDQHREQSLNTVNPELYQLISKL